MRVLNLGILAHVDAGKTTLTEALLQCAGVIETAGSVDDGTTRTDTMELERRRGITIRASAVSFDVGDLTVNILDTPGHPDFIAEVERSLSVLDAAVLVLSAVEGVQAQSIVLFRALRRMGVPTLIFVNKLDRAGADPERVVAKIRDRLTPDLVVLSEAYDAGGKGVTVADLDPCAPTRRGSVLDQLVTYDDDLFAAAVADFSEITEKDLRASMRAQVARGTLYPVFLGAAALGIGVGELVKAFRELLPSESGDPQRPCSGVIFKVDRGAEGAKVAYVRMYEGCLTVRDRVSVAGARATRITRLELLAAGSAHPSDQVGPGRIARLYGLRDARIGDVIGVPPTSRRAAVFPSPLLEATIVPKDPADRERLHAALGRLADQDPLIDLRLDDRRRELCVSLYGEVQKEVIQQTLAQEDGVETLFRATTTICREVPLGRGEAVERMGERGNPFAATLGLRVEPGPVDSGVEFRVAADRSGIPLYLFKVFEAFEDTMTRNVLAALQQGLYGWQVSDCIVTLTECGYASPATRVGDYRKLTPPALMEALRHAGTAVCEPIYEIRLEVPAASTAAVLRLLGGLRGTARHVIPADSLVVIEGAVPAAELHHLQDLLVGTTQGEGVVEAHFEQVYTPVTGTPPTSPQFDEARLDRADYFRRLLG